MEKKDRVLQKFNEGLNCGEAIVSEYCEELELNRETAMRIFKELGGGMNSGEICGALSAGILVVGMSSNDKSQNAGKKLRDKFLNKHRNMKCRELLQGDVSTKCGFDKIIEDDGFRRICPVLVGDIVDFIEEINNKND